LDGNHPIADRFADVLLVIAAGASFHLLPIHGGIVESQLHGVEARTGIHNRHKQKREGDD